MSTSMRTAVVTGSSGFIGRHVVASLLERGVEVRRVDLRADHPRDALDVRHPLPDGLFAGADVVVHLAALAGVARSVEHPLAYSQTNVGGTRRVVEAARRNGVPRLVVASSSSVYGECEEPAGERRHLGPLSPYAESKVAAEAVAARHAGAAMAVAVVRPFTVFGPGQRPDMLIGRLLRGEATTLWAFERDFTPVADVAAAMVAAATMGAARPFEVFNLGTGRPLSAHALLDAIADVTGTRPAVEWGPPRPCEPVRTWADSTRARARLGFDPPADPRTTLAEQAAVEGPTGGPARSLLSSA